MKHLPGRPLLSMALVIVLGALLLGLGVLQYRWSGQVSEAEQERMQAGLDASANQFRLQFTGELERIGLLLQPDIPTINQQAWKRYAEAHSATLGSFNLVRGVYLWIGGDDAQLLRLDPRARAFQSAPWPAEFDLIGVRYRRAFADFLDPRLGLRPFSWTMAPQVPAMLQPIIRHEGAGDDADPKMIGLLIVHLDPTNMQRELFPELARRCFGGPDGFIYHVAVVDGRDNNRRILYRSDFRLTVADFDHADARIGLLMPRGRMGGRPPIGMGAPPPPDYRARRGPAPLPLMRRQPAPIFEDGTEEDGGMELLAIHRQGSLVAAVARLRIRNLALGFGSLFLLAASIGLIVISSRRAQRLAKLQIDFVASVSHELRTPLTVICSAGDNLAHGVGTESQETARRYGKLVVDEGRKLAAKIDQILSFASMQRGRRFYHLRRESVNVVVENALQLELPALQAAGFSVRKRLAEDLPSVNVDPAALSQAVRNLIENAIKYSGDSRWIEVRTEHEGAEVQIVVEDSGIGIARAELTHVFEPFYRGSAATAAQIHGTGLGLSMAREALTSMAGTISVNSVAGKGSVFVIRLPAMSSTGVDPGAPIPEGQVKERRS